MNCNKEFEEATTKGGKRSYYEGFFVVKAGHQKEKEIEEIQAADWAAAQQLTTCRGGMNRFECLREDEEAMEELAGLRPMTPEREVAWQEEIEQAMEMDEISKHGFLLWGFGWKQHSREWNGWWVEPGICTQCVWSHGL